MTHTCPFIDRFILSSQDFIDDTEVAVDEPEPEYGKCTQVIATLEDGTELYCDEPCNPAEQLCHACRNGASLFAMGVFR